MQSSRYRFGAAMAVAVIVGLYGSQGAYAQSEKAYVPKAKMTSLVQGPLAGVEGKDVFISHLELPPNFVGGKHWHPGPVFVYVLEGELTVETEDGVQSFKAGEVFSEPIKRTMRGKNLNTAEAVKLLIFQVGDAGKPMMIQAD